MADIRQYTNVIRTANSGESVRDAIVNCMKDINADSAIKATNLSITKDDNVTYTAPKGYAFKNVTVNIDSEGETDPDKTYTFEELSITSSEPQEYVPEGTNKAYSKVIVDIEGWDALTSHLGEEATMTEVLTDEATGQKYWDADLAGFDYVKRIWIGDSAAINLPDYPGGGGGAGGTGPFTVTFYDEKNTMIGSVSGISYGGSAYTKMSTELEEKVKKIESNGKFSNWSPRVDYVTGSYQTKPQMIKASAGGSLDQYTWEDILSNQAKFSPGSTATIISDEVTVPAVTIYGKALVDKYGSPGHDVLTMPEHTYGAGFLVLNVMLVAHGEGGTNSTWLATTPIGKTLDQFREAAGGSLDGVYGMRAETTGCDDMTSTIEYQFLDKYLSYFFPEPVRSALRIDNTKAQWGFSSYTYSIVDVRNNETGKNLFTLQKGGKAGRIWLPSMTELRGWAQTAVSDEADAYNSVDGSGAEWHRITDPIFTCKSMDPHIVDFNENPTGKNDYSAVWRPSVAAYTSYDTLFLLATRSTLRARWHANTYIGPAPNGLMLLENHHDAPIFSALNTFFPSNWFIGFNT